MATCFGCLQQRRLFDHFIGGGAAWRSSFFIGSVCQFCLHCLVWLAAGTFPGGFAGRFVALFGLCRLDVAGSRLLGAARWRLAMAPALPMVWRSIVVHVTGGSGLPSKLHETLAHTAAVGSNSAVSTGILPSRFANAPFVRLSHSSPQCCAFHSVGG
eukprot:5810548-Prorocentrum_lima.AAC.1